MPNYFKKFYKLFNILNCKVKDNLSKLLFKDIGYNPLIISILINCFLYLLLLLLTTPVYRSNDDIILNLTSAGFFGKEYTEFILFGNIILGKLLKLFYTISSQYNWYLLFLIFTQIVSHIVILYYLLMASNKYLTLFIYICLFSIFSINLFTEISFSGSSLIALSGALLIIISILHKKIRNISDYILFFIFLILSLIIRKDTFSIFCYLFLIFPIIYLKKWKELLIIFLLAIICNTALNALNKACYKNIDPLQLEYQKARVLFQDRNPVISEEELTKMGWSKDDYALFASFKGIDDKFFNKYAVIKNSKLISFKFDFKRIFLSPYSLCLYFINDIYYYSLGFIVVFILFILMRKTRKFLFSLISIWILLFFVLGIILVHYRLYIYFTILFYLCVVGGFFILQKNNLSYCQGIFKRFINYIAILLIFTISISLVKTIHSENKIRNNIYINYDNKVNELRNSSHKFLIIGEESEYFFGKLAIFHSFNNNIEERLKELVIPTGWFINTIQFDRIVNGPVIQELISGNIYVLGKDEEFFNSIKFFIYGHYNLKVDFVIQDSYKYSNVYRLINSVSIN